jgi:outer membrane lipoprotein-sorting protein
MGWRGLRNWERRRVAGWVVFWAATGLLVNGCAAKHPAVAPPSMAPARLLTATKQQLVASFNEQASSIRSVNASVSMKLTAGTAYSGVIKQYHEISGFILAERPASIRVIGQAPVVGTTVFDMVSDGTTFHMFIPSKKTFLEGPANLQRESAKPIENLRPQHLVQAIFWTAIPPDRPVLLEAGDEAEARYYILTVAGKSASGGTAGVSRRNEGLEWQVEQKIWYDRMDLSVARVQVYDGSGDVTSDIRYGRWHDFAGVRFAQEIEITRPSEDYELQIRIKKLTANEAIPADRFEMKQPPGSQLVHVGEEKKEPQP